jgi:hypothetical protein
LEGALKRVWAFWPTPPRRTADNFNTITQYLNFPFPREPVLIGMAVGEPDYEADRLSDLRTGRQLEAKFPLAQLDRLGRSL